MFILVFRILVVLIAVSMNLDFAAQAAPDSPIKLTPMKVDIVRSNKPGCEPECAEWIAAEGGLTEDSVAAFRRVFARMGDRKLPILLSSNGGSVLAGETIGRMIRERQLDVIVARTHYDGCSVTEGRCRALKPGETVYTGTPFATISVCASACVMVLAGGVNRLLDRYSVIGVHQETSFRTRREVMRRFLVKYRMINGQKVEISRELVSEKPIRTTTFTVKTPKSAYDKTRAYYAEMGVSAGIMPLIENTPRESIHWMTRDEIFSTQICSRVESADDVLTRASTRARLEAFTHDGHGAQLIDGAAAGGAIELGPYKGYPAIAHVEFWQVPQKNQVSMVVTLADRSTVLSARGAAFSLNGATQNLEAQSRLFGVYGEEPLVATVSAEAFCDFMSKPEVKADLVDTTRSSNHASVQVNLASLTGMARFKTQICRLAALPVARRPAAALPDPALAPMQPGSTFASLPVQLDFAGQLTDFLLTMKPESSSGGVRLRLVSDEQTEKRAVTEGFTARFTLAEAPPVTSGAQDQTLWSVTLPRDSFCAAAAGSAIEIGFAPKGKNQFVSQRFLLSRVENFKALRSALCESPGRT